MIVLNIANTLIIKNDWFKLDVTSLQLRKLNVDSLLMESKIYSQQIRIDQR